jgi:hypothetical protein
MSIANHTLDSLLNLRSKVAAVLGVDPSIHEAETIGGAYYGVTGYIKNRTVVDLDEFQIAAETTPCVG